jgi:hypothetical protein
MKNHELIKTDLDGGVALSAQDPLNPTTNDSILSAITITA